MINMVQTEKACHNSEMLLEMQPYADGSEKFKQSKESQDTLEKTTKQESETAIGIVTQSSAANENKGKLKKGGLLYKSGHQRKEDKFSRRHANMELMGATESNRNSKRNGNGSGIGQPY